MTPNIESETGERNAIGSQTSWRSIQFFSMTLAVAVLGGGLWVYASQKRARPRFVPHNQVPAAQQAKSDL